MKPCHIAPPEVPEVLVTPAAFSLNVTGKTIVDAVGPAQPLKLVFV